jgi:methionyl-tRNA formyltransferase
VTAGHDVATVVTRPDARRSRRGTPTPSPVAAVAQGHGLAVAHQPDAAAGAGAEVGVVVAYGRIIRPPLLGALPLVNVHFSLLPRWRGAAPVERAILAGDADTGVSLMEVEAGLDTGPVYARRATPIGPEETADELVTRLAGLGAELLLELLSGPLPVPEPQSGEPTYADKITPDDLRLGWERPAAELARVVRAGRAWTTWRGKRLLVLRAAEPAPDAPGVDGPPGTLSGPVVATGAGALRLVTVQPEGRPAVDAVAWARGARPAPGERMGS